MQKSQWWKDLINGKVTLTYGLLCIHVHLFAEMYNAHKNTHADVIWWDKIPPLRSNSHE